MSSSFLDCLKEDDASSSDNKRNYPINDQQKSTALHYARNIQYPKRMQEKVPDLIINAIDLPSNPNAISARPTASDAALFKKALTVFQPKDVDDMVLERNIYEKCGYALCPRPNLTQTPELRDRVFRSMKKERKFKVNTKEELEKWCSGECAERALFVRLQLGTEPAWVRTDPVEDIMLLEESERHVSAHGLVSPIQDLALKERRPVDIATGLRNLVLNQGKKSVIQDRMQALSTERGRNGSTGISDEVTLTSIKERNTMSTPSAPQNFRGENDIVEGHKLKSVRFAHQFDSESNSENEDQDMEMDT